MIALMLAASTGTDAGWVSRQISARDTTAPTAIPRGLKSIDALAVHLQSLPANVTALGAHLSSEGHWTLINRAGERITTASEDELKRARAILTPAAASSGDSFTVHLSADSLFAPRARFDDLPAAANITVFIGTNTFPLRRIGRGDKARLLVEIRPNILAEATTRATFHDTVWHLSRSLDRTRLRVLSVDPNAPGVIATTPRMDPDTGRALVDHIAPGALLQSISALRRQTAILVARRDAGYLVVKPSSGSEVRFAASDIAAAARAADLNLIIFHAATPTQPGGRNWLFLKTGVRGLEDELSAPTIADLISALTGPSRHLAVTSRTNSDEQVLLEFSPTTDLAVSTIDYSRVVDVIKGMIIEFSGKTAIQSAEAMFRSADRQAELNARLLPGIPADLQYGYAALLALGLIGAPVSRRWWRRIWPQEQRSDYPGRLGFELARAIRYAAFRLIFAPLTSLISAPMHLIRRALHLLTRRSPLQHPRDTTPAA
jgi:hypothetical protein